MSGKDKKTMDCGCGSEKGGKTSPQGPMKALNVEWAGGPPPPPPVRVSMEGQPFVAGWIDTPAGKIPRVSNEVTGRDVLGRWGARWGIGRMSYAVAPGLYAFGSPDRSSPVAVTANYKLTFDLLRKEWKGKNLWVLALDTKGINVWCAAGKGTFGTAEIIKRVEAARLSDIVDHRELILPQLGAPGVKAHEVTRNTGFKILYGPVRASDLGRYLETGKKAETSMRRVTFTALERFVLTPMEVVGFARHFVKILLLSLIISGFGHWGWNAESAMLRGFQFFAATFLGILAGGVLTPVLLPFIPVRMFSLKGALAGLAVAAAALALAGGGLNRVEAFAFAGALTALASYSAMNYTGASTYTSPTGVLKEMRRSLPLQAGTLILSLIAWVAGGFFRGA